MKRNYYLHITVIAAAMGCMIAGCKDEALNEMEKSAVAGMGNEASRTQLIEKSISGIEADKLPTLLTDEEKATVQKLVLQGKLCGADIYFIKTELPELLELDIKDVEFKIMGNDKDYYYLHETPTFNKKMEDVNSVGTSMFRELKKMQRVILPESVTTIGPSAFEYSKELTSVTIPKSVKLIDQYAFRDCHKLENVNFGPILKEIGWYAFSGTGLRSVLIQNNIQFIRNGAFNNIDSLESVVIDNGKVIMDEYAFSNCNKLKSVKLDERLTNIPDKCFENCTALENITLPAKLKNLGSYAFKGTGLKNVVIPESVTMVNEYAFRECSSLSEVVFMSDKTEVGKGLFRGCVSLEKINIPDVEEITDEMFYFCSKLKNITLPKNIKRIGTNAFREAGITEIEIPESVERLGKYCFSYTKLSTLTVPENVSVVGDGIVSGCNQMYALYWYSNDDLDYNYTGNDNCFLFTNSKNGSSISWKDDWNNVVIDGIAEEITCKNDDNKFFFNCPQEIKAKVIKYTKEFSAVTSIGTSKSWSTISLPFKPTKIVTEDGRILVPFGSSKETEETKPFWLRETSENGFVDVTEIEPYKPYIICMPYSNDYLPEYNIKGKVTFMAENITLKATPEVMTGVKGPNYTFYPSMNYIAASPEIYALGQSGYEYFRNNRYKVMPFEAYIKMDEQQNAGTESIDVTKKAKASRSVTVYDRKPGVPHINDME